MTRHVVYGSAVPFQALGGGVKRRVLAHQPGLMMVEVAFDESAEGAAHAHPHAQCTYVLSGRFQFTMDDKTVMVEAGDALTFFGGQVHGCRCERAGTLLDVFTPAREDFL